jgi:tetratricopeptide (TPR) repeat protein
MRRTLHIGFLVVGLVGLACWARPLAAQQAASGAAPVATQQTQQIEEVVEASKRFRGGDLQGAKALLDAAVEKHPSLPPPRLILAQWLAQANQAAAMHVQLELAVAEMPNDPEAYVLLGDLALQGGRWTEADLLFQKAGELVADFKGNSRRKNAIEHRTLQGLALVAQNRQDWPTSQKYWQQLLAQDAANPVALQQLAWVLFQQDQPTEALEKLKAAHAANKESLTPEAILAQFYQRKGDTKNAKHWMIAAINAAPKDLRTRLVAAEWSLTTDQLQEAEEQADAALQLDANSLDAQFLRGMVALHRKDYPKASECFQKVVDASPNHFVASNSLALALAEQDEAAKKKALVYAEKNAEQFPDQADAFSTLGRIYYNLGQLDKAEEALRKAASLGPMSADMAYYIACVSVDRDRNDEARQLLTQALRSTGPFLMRPEAKKLLEKLTGNANP